MLRFSEPCDILWPPKLRGCGKASLSSLHWCACWSPIAIYQCGTGRPRGWSSIGAYPHVWPVKSHCILIADWIPLIFHAPSLGGIPIFVGSAFSNMSYHELLDVACTLILLGSFFRCHIWTFLRSVNWISLVTGAEDLALQQGLSLCVICSGLKGLMVSMDGSNQNKAIEPRDGAKTDKPRDGTRFQILSQPISQLQS